MKTVVTLSLVGLVTISVFAFAMLYEPPIPQVCKDMTFDIEWSYDGPYWVNYPPWSDKSDYPYIDHNITLMVHNIGSTYYNIRNRVFLKLKISGMSGINEDLESSFAIAPNETVVTSWKVRDKYNRYQVPTFKVWVRLQNGAFTEKPLVEWKLSND